MSQLDVEPEEDHAEDVWHVLAGNCTQSSVDVRRWYKRLWAWALGAFRKLI